MKSKKRVIDVIEGYVETAKDFNIRLVLYSPMLIPEKLSTFKKKIRITVEELPCKTKN